MLFLAQNAPETVWRRSPDPLGELKRPLGELKRSPNPLAAVKGLGPRGGEGKGGGEEKEGGEKGRKGRGDEGREGKGEGTRREGKKERVERTERGPQFKKNDPPLRYQMADYGPDLSIFYV